MSTAIIFSLLCALGAIVYGVMSTSRILALSPGNEEMQRISLAVQEGASAYLKRQYITIGLVGVVLFVVILFGLDAMTAYGFAIGAVLSGVVGFIGMHVSVRSNSRTAEAAKGGVPLQGQVPLRQLDSCLQGRGYRDVTVRVRRAFV